MTMFCGVRALQPHRVDEEIEGDGDGEQRAGGPVERTPSVRIENTDSTVPKLRASSAVSRPRGMGRGRPCGPCARRYLASYHMYSAPAAPAPMAMASSAMAPSTGWIAPGAATMPVSCREHDERHHTRLQQLNEIADIRPADRTNVTEIGICARPLHLTRLWPRIGPPAP